jgi:hypothetical protein
MAIVAFGGDNSPAFFLKDRARGQRIVPGTSDPHGTLAKQMFARGDFSLANQRTKASHKGVRE